jgi:hypothetical protein
VVTTPRLDGQPTVSYSWSWVLPPRSVPPDGPAETEMVNVSCLWDSQPSFASTVKVHGTPLFVQVPPNILLGERTDAEEQSYGFPKTSYPPRILKSRTQFLPEDLRLALVIGKRLGKAVEFEAEFRIAARVATQFQQKLPETPTTGNVSGRMMV